MEKYQITGLTRCPVNNNSIVHYSADGYTSELHLSWGLADSGEEHREKLTGYGFGKDDIDKLIAWDKDNRSVVK